MVMCAQQFDFSRALIVGMGVSGLSCARFLGKQGIRFRVADSRNNPPSLEQIQQEFPDCVIHTGGFDADLLNNIDILVLSPGVSIAHPFVQLAMRRRIDVIGDIELFARHVNAPVIAITGSNGKSTVTTLVGELMQAAGLDVAVGGNLGTPALDLLRTPAPSAYVLELSSFQLETTFSLKPHIATVLNVSIDHMDRYASFADYAKSKARIYHQAKICVANRDDAIVKEMLNKNTSTIRFFGSDQPANKDDFGMVSKSGQTWLARGEQTFVSTRELKLVGKHNALNALAALTMSCAFGAELEEMIPVLKTFPGLPHRCQWIAEHNDVRWINDSKATNVGAAQAAIDSMPGSVILIAGGDGKDADFNALRSSVATKVRTALLLGKDAGLLHNALGDITNCHQVNDMREAVSLAAMLARPGQTVLLAPACASFDMFSGFAERGEVFSRCVHEVLEN